MPEIQHIIFDTLYGDSRGMATLAALARTAHCFQEVALDRLWHTQTSLVPLVRCFPPTVVSEEAGEYGVQVMNFVSEPKPEDWTRVKFYAPRIKAIRSDVSFEMDPLWDGELAEEACIILQKSKGSAPLLPNLHSFEWTQRVSQWTKYCRTPAIASFPLMLNPQVSSMDVVVNHLEEGGPAEAIAAALRKFGNEFRQLRSINFVCPPCGPVEEAVLDLAYRHPQLKSFKCSRSRSMTVEAITHLSTLQALQEVSIVADRETTLSVVKVAKSRAYCFFSALRSLVLQTESLELCKEWLDIVRTPSVNNLTFIVEQSLTAKDFAEFLTLLVERGGLEHLRFVCKTPCPRDSPGYSIIPTALAPLLQLNLVTLQLEPGMPIDIDNSFVERMARAWPRLQTLELNAEWRRYPERTPLVTIPGLLPLTDHCPHMTSLAITFNPNLFPFQGHFAAGDRPAGGHSFSLDKPFRLGVGATVIAFNDYGFRLATVLSDFCPGLVTLDNAWARAEDEIGEDLDLEEPEINENWQQVHKYAKELARVRRQERLYMY
ncbi:hypothetical protein PYCCODRAFT_1377693 [Trametes coccinea BRFM310]|uniref:F-box domain-containing protein n=1 Tax=Trametes coccinea (strain BRFM310) TaxID=1353009 RepID=A0A1Y2I9T2_TRAC3|nr:hypothetical protein PYCCODRAFT_1377693 [Trametes coccinea BRFM310]